MMMAVGSTTTLAAQVRAGDGDSTAVVRGTVYDSARQSPLAFAVISISEQSIQRFTGSDGSFVLRGLRPGHLVLDVRRIGYRPSHLAVDVGPAEERTITVALSQVALSLPAITVQARNRCDSPGPPRAGDDSSLAAIFEQVHQNAVQYRLFAAEHPFILYLDRTTTIERRDGSVDEAAHDTLVLTGGDAWTYRPGRVVELAPGSNQHASLHIPSLETLADSAFISAHCFFDAGIARVGDNAWLRVDFRADDRLQVPDVSGAMYLDTATYQVRREVIRLSRPSRQMSWVDGVEVTTTFDEIYPSISAISTVTSRTTFATAGVNARARAEVETQRRLSLRLLSAVDRDRAGVASTASGISPTRASGRAIVTIEAIDSVTGAPIPATEVYDSTSATTLFTDAGGRARLALARGTNASITVRHIGYGMKGVSIALPDDVRDSTTVRVLLLKTAQLDAVVVKDSSRRYISHRLSTFLERQQAGIGGYFIGDSILRLAEGRRLGDLMRSRVPGVILTEGSHGSQLLFQSPRCASGGPPQVYLDGVPLAAPQPADPPDPNKTPVGKRDQLKAIPPFDLSQFQISDLAGVEYYPDNDSAPVEFAHTSQRCGALYLWTRER